MADHQRVVEEIRSFLQSADQTLSDRLKELASAYADACREANARLRRCEEFLQKGLRSEAVHLAQAEPVLLDLVAVLDFPERGQWDEILFTYGLPAAPRLNLATAEALNEAYASVQPLEQLLRKHRLLALARAPLTTRLEVMRQIARVDAGNPLWAEDIRTFEKIRIRDLEKEVNHALEHGNARAVEAVFGEIRATDWVAAPPLHLIQRVEGLARERDQKRFRDLMKGLETEIHEAVAAFDVERVRRLRERWNEEALKGKLPLKDPLWERVSPAFDWLAEQDRRKAEEKKQKAAVQKLEMGLKDGAPPEELERLYRALVARDGIPEELEILYRTRVDALKAVARRRRRLLLGGLLAVGLVVASGIGYLVYQDAQKDKVTKAAQTLRALLEAEDYALATKYLQDLDANEPRLAQAPELVEWRGRVEKAQEREDVRLQNFRQALADLKAAPLGDEEAPARALRWARTAEEKKLVRDIERDRKEKAELAKQKRAQEFEARLNDLRKEAEDLKEAQAKATADERKLLASLVELEAKLQTLKKDYPDKGERLTFLTELLGGIRRSLGRTDRAGELVDRLASATQLSDTGEEYAKAVQAYLNELGDTPRGRALKRVLEEQDLWREVLEWNRLLKSWRDLPLNLRPADARALVAQVREFQQAHPKAVDAKTVQLYALCLEAIAQQDESQAHSAAGDLRQLFDTPLIQNLWILREGGRTYYLRKSPETRVELAKEESQELIGIQYLFGLEGRETKKNIVVKGITEVGKAPQSVVAEKVKKIPANFADRTWEQGTLAVAQAVRDSAGMDPILKLSLLKQVLALAGKGSHPLALALADHTLLIEQTKLDLKVPWVNPVSDSADRVRPQAQKVLAQLPPLAPVAEAVVKKKQEVEAAVRQSYHEVAGCLILDKQKGWQCRPGVQGGGDRVVSVLTVQPNQGPAWKAVGKVAGGQVHLDADNPELVEGRLVFVTEKN